MFLRCEFSVIIIQKVIWQNKCNLISLFFFSCRVMCFVSSIVFHSFSSLLIAKSKAVLQHSIMESVLILQNIVFFRDGAVVSCGSLKYI